MAMLELSIPRAASSRQRIQLEGRDYYLTLRRNIRLDRWFFGLYDAQGAPIVEGRKLMFGRDLLRGVGSPAKPPGGLYVADFEARGRDPDGSNFGAGVGLVYVESAP
jgi:hypothetical protein